MDANWRMRWKGNSCRKQLSDILTMLLLATLPLRVLGQELDNAECNGVDLVVDAMLNFTAQSSYNMSLGINETNIVGDVTGMCPENVTLADSLELTCTDLVVDDAMIYLPLVVCYSALPPGVLVRITDEDVDENTTYSSTRPTSTTGGASPTGSGSGSGQEDCDEELDDFFKYGLIGGLGASGLLNIILILVLVFVGCSRGESSTAIAQGPAKVKERAMTDIVVPNKHPGAGWGGKSETIVHASNEQWCVTPNATISQAVLPLERSDTFDLVETTRVRERLPLTEDLYVHGQVRENVYSTEQDADYSSVTVRHTSHTADDGNEHQQASRAAAASPQADLAGDSSFQPLAAANPSHTSFTESGSSGQVSPRTPERRESSASQDPFVRPAAHKPPEHEYRVLEPTAQHREEANGIDPEHTYVTHASTQPREQNRLSDMTPQKTAPGDRLLSSDYLYSNSRHSIVGSDGEIRSYL
eukprot:scpid49990/ scgid1089/ 